ncbi:MAG: redoxin domain-containing protein [Acidobacteria bacterium]|nr:redoxin domain-containing protein [Acidobacteriota bacterium]
MSNHKISTRKFLATAAGTLGWSVAALGGVGEPIQMKSKAPDLQGSQWIHTHGPSAWKERKGLVTIVHFWTYGCINCKHNLPSYARWQKHFAGRKVEIIGIHTPEFDHEAVAANVEKKVREFGIEWPVLLDPQMVNWRRWNQQYWPAVYLVDKEGRIRYRWDGELNYRGLSGERRMQELAEGMLREGEDA